MESPLHDDVQCIVLVNGVPDDAITVASFRVREELSELVVWALELTSASDVVATLEEQLGAEAKVAILRDGVVERVAHGIVTEVLPEGALLPNDRARTRVVVEPRLANLAYSGGFRIFQDQSIEDIVATLVAPEAFDVVWRTKDALSKRDYRTQFDETDLDFIRRLAADEGFHFFFEHTNDKTSLVFTNQPEGFRALENGELSFVDTEGAVAGEHVRELRRARRVRTGAVEHRDYDFERSRATLKGRAETDAPQSPANTIRRERRDYPGWFLDPDAEGTPRARARLHELRSDAVTCEGTASTLRFAPGKTFTVSGHRDRAFNRKVILTGVVLSGRVPIDEARSHADGGARVHCELSAFRGVPGGTFLRPVRRPKPTARLQTARVVGPAEGDPYVDKYGRIKVQFPWDRDGRFDEHTSCWIRMMTPSARGDEGFFSAHKVGSEVVVDFLDGDVDRPVVLGALYNAQQAQPYKQPDAVAKSSWKVKSIPGGQGYNEITLDNTAGAENVLTHAQRNRTSHVLNADAETIGTSQTSAVGTTQAISVGTDRSVTVGGSETIAISKERHETVDATEDVTVKKGRTHTIEEGGDTLTVHHGARTVVVDDGDHSTSVAQTTWLATDDVNTHARKTITVTGDEKITVVQGTTTATMKGGNVELIAAGHVMVVHKGTTIRIDEAGKVMIAAEPELEIVCQGADFKMGAGKVEISAPTEIALKVGRSAVKLTAAGVETSGPSVKSAATGMSEVSGLVVKLN